MMVKTLTPFHYRVTSKLEKLSKHSACSIFLHQNTPGYARGATFRYSIIRVSVVPSKRWRLSFENSSPTFSPSAQEMWLGDLTTRVCSGFCKYFSVTNCSLPRFSIMSTMNSSPFVMEFVRRSVIQKIPHFRPDVGLGKRLSIKKTSKFLHFRELLTCFLFYAFVFNFFSSISRSIKMEVDATDMIMIPTISQG